MTQNETYGKSESLRLGTDWYIRTPQGGYAPYAMRGMELNDYRLSRLHDLYTRGVIVSRVEAQGETLSDLEEGLNDGVKE